MWNPRDQRQRWGFTKSVFVCVIICVISHVITSSSLPSLSSSAQVGHTHRPLCVGWPSACNAAGALAGDSQPHRATPNYFCARLPQKLARNASRLRYQRVACAPRPSTHMPFSNTAVRQPQSIPPAPSSQDRARLLLLSAREHRRSQRLGLGVIVLDYLHATPDFDLRCVVNAGNVLRLFAKTAHLECAADRLIMHLHRMTTLAYRKRARDSLSIAYVCTPVYQREPWNVGLDGSAHAQPQANVSRCANRRIHDTCARMRRVMCPV